MSRVTPEDAAGSWFLDQRTGWRTDSAATGPTSGIAVGEALTLTAIGGGPLALDSPDGSLGGLILPRGIALGSDQRIYLLGLHEPLVRRFEAETRRFEILDTVGGEGTDARRFREPGNIAVGGSRLFVADTGNRRVQVFDTDTLALLWLGRPGGAWRPVDIAATKDATLVLDALGRRVYRFDLERQRLELVVQIDSSEAIPERIAIDRAGDVHVLVRTTDPSTARLLRFDTQGRYRSTAHDAGAVRTLFDVPPITVDHRGRFGLEGELARACPPLVLSDACDDDAKDDTDDTEEAAQPVAVLDLIYDRDGRSTVIDRSEPAGPKRFVRAGTWISTALDSGIAQCQWHRIELDLAALPEGTLVRVLTNTTDRPTASSETAPPASDPFWVGHPAFVGRARRPGEARPRGDDEVAVLSGAGRFLWLRVELEGDAYETPTVRSMRIHFPRRSYLDFLPAVYSAEEESRRFLERFLSVFQTEWDAFDAFAATFARYLDPEAIPDPTPSGDFVSYLADWFALPLEGSWSPKQKRRFLAAAVQLAPLRGTPEGLRRYLHAYLANIADLPDDAPPYPRIVEGFRDRDRLMLGNGPGDELGNASPLWGPGFVGRLQLDVFAKEGDVRLISTGDPARDLFHEYAHRFRVFVPSSWVGDAEDERMLRRAVEAEKPAHTTYELCLVEPRFRVGVQSTIGIDTIVGRYPVARVQCEQHTDAPSRAPSNRLGFDTVLARADRWDLPTAPAPRVGLDTRVA